MVVATLVLVAGGRIGWQYYQWYRHAPERDLIVVLQSELEDAAVGVITTQITSDTLQQNIEAADVQLGRGRVLLDNLERRLAPTRADEAYMRQLKEFNQRVSIRNQMVDDWRMVVASNHEYVDRYNLLADSMRSVADRMGEPYYPIRTPAEIATARGVAVVAGSRHAGSGGASDGHSP